LSGVLQCVAVCGAFLEGFVCHSTERFCFARVFCAQKSVCECDPLTQSITSTLTYMLPHTHTHTHQDPLMSVLSFPLSLSFSLVLSLSCVHVFTELANKILGETNTSVDCSFHRHLPGHAPLQHTATQSDKLQHTAPSSSDSSSSIFTVSLVRGIATPSMTV